MLMTADYILRKPEPKDVPQLYQYRNDWNAIRSLGGFSTGYSIKDLENWVEAHRNRANEVLWVIANKENGDCLGHVGLYEIDYRIRSAEFAIFIGDTNYWGRGLGTRITQDMLKYGFEQLNLHRIELSVLATHDSAIGLYEKHGFKKEGCRRQAQFRDGRYVDIWVMGLLEDEWRNQS